LISQVRENSVLSKILLYEGPSPVDSVRLAGETTIQASTFDWYVPVVSPWGVYADVIKDTGFAQLAASGGKKAMMATGGVSIHLLAANPLAAAAEMRENKVPPSSIADYGPVPAMQVMGGPAPLGAVAHVFDDLTDLGDLVALADVSLDKAERRHVRTEDVSLAWQLDWKAERLEVRLSGKPENRPFQVHIVVEETVYSGEVAPDNIAYPFSDQLLREQIHTPFVAEIVNQLVGLVPRNEVNGERGEPQTDRIRAVA